MNLTNFTEEQLQHTAQELVNQAEEIINNLNKVEGISIEKTSKTMYAIIEVKLYDVLLFIRQFNEVDEKDVANIEETKNLVNFWKEVLSKAKSILNAK